MKKLKRLIILLLISMPAMHFASISADGKGRSKERYDVFLLIGQSNMAGRGYMIEGDEQPFNDNVYLLNDKGEIEPAANPLNKYSTIRKDMSMQRIGPGFGFSRKIAEKTGRKILLVVNARGGSSIKEWKVGAEKAYYDEAVRRTRQALAHNGKLKAILWHQGETDATDHGYMEELADMVTSMRKDLKAKKVPFIAGEIAYWIKESGEFNERIAHISEYIGNAACISAENCTMLIDEEDPHFSRDAQIMLGERYADAVLRICYKTRNK